MRPSENSEQKEEASVLTMTFSGRTVGQHALGLLCGPVLWGVVYSTFLTIIPGSESAVWTSTTPATVETRVHAAVVATLLTGVYYGILVILGVGGPVLNLLSAGVPYIVMPRIVHRLVGQAPEEYFRTIGPLTWTTQRGTDMKVLIPGMLMVLLVPVLWFLTVCRDKDRRQSWVEERLPEFAPEEDQ